MANNNEYVTLVKDGFEITVPIGFSFEYLLFGFFEVLRRKDYEYIILCLIFYALSIFGMIFEKNFLYLFLILFTNLFLAIFYNKLYIIQRVVYKAYSPKSDKDLEIIKNYNILKGL